MGFVVQTTRSAHGNMVTRAETNGGRGGGGGFTFRSDPRIGLARTLHRKHWNTALHGG